MQTGCDRLLPEDPPVVLIDPAGTVVERADFQLPPPAALRRALAGMIAARRLNEQAYAAVRQGQLAVYPSSHGQEACQIACAQALADGDWLFPTYRDTAAVIARGVEPAAALALLEGYWHCGYDPGRCHVAPQATPIATHLLHAVGVAHAARLRGEPTVALALCGDGATSAGDFHAALNFAAVFRAAVVFLVQNNGYAISVPLSRQSAAPSLAHKGIGYGIPGHRVDGNDVAALLAVLATCVAHARAGGGPSLVEALTYRIQGHTNADDPSRYRDFAEVERWQPRDPVRRLERYLSATGELDQAQLAALHAAGLEQARRVRASLGARPEPDPAELFRHVYAEPTVQLEAQYALVLDEQSREEHA